MEKRKKTSGVKVRLTKGLHARLKDMAERRGIPISSLATFYVTKGLEGEEDLGGSRKAGMPENGERGAGSADR